MFALLPACQPSVGSYQRGAFTIEPAFSSRAPPDPEEFDGIRDFLALPYHSTKDRSDPLWAHCRAILDDALHPDDQIFANLRPLNAAMGAEVIAMRSFKGTDARFVAPQ